MSASFELDKTCFLLDLDGTLLDYAARPEIVKTPHGLTSVLADLIAATEGAVAIVSGRPIHEFDQLLTPLRFAAAGVHGAEMRTRADAPVESLLENRLPDALWRDLLAGIPPVAGVFAENKRYAYAVHYREAPHLRPALIEIIDRLVASSDVADIEILDGRFVFEIKTSARNKGDAVLSFMRQPEFAGRRPIYIGDDVTDVPGIAATVRLGGLAYSVGCEVGIANGRFENAAAVREWLAGIAAVADVRGRA